MLLFFQEICSRWETEQIVLNWVVFVSSDKIYFKNLENIEKHKKLYYRL